MSAPLIEIRDLVKTFQLEDVEVHALRGVSLAIERGEFVAIMGASGSGKSTLMNILGCLDRPSSGQYLLDGADVATLDEPSLARTRSLQIGFVFQSFNLLARTSAAENVVLPLFYSGRMRDGPARGHEILAMLGLDERERSYPSQLSGGQQQRVAIARALINDPSILLADEPTGNLDSKTSEDILAIIQAFNREKGLTVVLVTHEQDVAAFADRVVTLRDGAIVSDRHQVARKARPASDLELRFTEHALATPENIGPARGGGWMFFHMAFLAAGRALTRNKMRSALTTLGVFIGVTALIVMVAVGQGAKAAVEAQIESLGTNLLVVVPGTTTSGGVRAGSGSASTLTVRDAEAIKDEAPAVTEVAYQTRQVAQVQYGDRNWATSIQGVSVSYLAVRNWAIVAGRAINAEDEFNVNRVCLLGQTPLRNLFGDDANPIGATIFVKNVPVEVIGVLEPKGQPAFGQDQDDVVLLPFTTAERKVLGVSTPTQVQAKLPEAVAFPPAPNPFGIQQKLTGFVNTIYVQAASTKLVPFALTQITQTLERRHHLPAGQPNDFGVRDQSEAIHVVENASRILALLLASVASISLLVGGIGIMNIMLVSVTERTREIGIRMAIGARRIHVLLQFLVEAVLLSAVGGGLGVVTGAVVSHAISAVVAWPALLSSAAMIGAFLFSACVGVFFGYYPARRASDLSPTEALRFE